MPDIDWSINRTEEKRKPTVDELDGMARRALVEKERFADATASSFYACLIFQSDEQRDAFIEAMKWRDAQDDEDPCFLDGLEIAKRIGVALPATPPERKTQSRKRWERLTQEA